MKKPDIETAIRIYYEYPEIGNLEIKELFNGISIATVCRYKEAARKNMCKKDIKTFNPYTVNTEAAYEAWGLDIYDLEKRRKKLMSLGLLG